MNLRHSDLSPWPGVIFTAALRGSSLEQECGPVLSAPGLLLHSLRGSGGRCLLRSRFSSPLRLRPQVMSSGCWGAKG